MKMEKNEIVWRDAIIQSLRRYTAHKIESNATNTDSMHE